MSGDLKKCPDGAVGVIFERDGKFLLFYRLTHPTGWAGVAGHLDGDLPEVAARKEAKEEVGVNILKMDFLAGPETISAQRGGCRRGDGSYNAHDWHLYRAHEWNGEARICEPDKHDADKGILWLPPDQIQVLFNQELHDPAWLYIFRKFGII